MIQSRVGPGKVGHESTLGDFQDEIAGRKVPALEYAHDQAGQPAILQTWG